MAAGKNVGTISVAVTPDTRGFREAVKRVSGDLRADLRLQPILLKKDISEAIKARNENPSKTKLHVAVDITKKAVSTALKEYNASPTTTKLKVGVEFSKVQVREALKLASKDLAVKVHIVTDTGELAAAKAATRKTFKVIGDEEFEQNKINAVRTQAFLTASEKKKLSIHEASTKAFFRVTEAEDKAEIALEKSTAITKEHIRRESEKRITAEVVANQKIRLAQERASLKNTPKSGGAIRAFNRANAQLFGFERSIDRTLRFTSLATAGMVAVIAGGFSYATGKAIASLARLEVSARNAAVIFAELEPGIRRTGSSLALVAAQARTTAQSVDAARKASLRSTFSAKEEADGLFFLASAGVRAKDAFKQLANITRFAQAGQFELAKAGELLLQSLNAAGEPIRRLTKVSDLLTEANIRSQTTLEDLAVALTNKSAAAFHLANQKISETIGLLQELGNVGITGRRAGENLAIAIREISRAASGAKDNEITKSFPSAEFKRIGVEVFDTSGKMKRFSTIVDLLADKLGGLKSRQLSLELKSLGLTEKSNNAIRALIVRSNALKGGLVGAVDALKKSAAGSTKAIAAGQLKTLSAQFALFRNNVVALAQVFAGPLAVGLTRLFKGIAGNGTLFDKFKDRAVAFGKSLARSVLPFLEKLRGASGKHFFQGLIDGIRGTLSGIKGFFVAFSRGFNGNKKSSSDFLTTFGELLKLFGSFIKSVGPKLGNALGKLAGFINNNRTLVKYLVIGIGSLYAYAKLARIAFKPLLTILDSTGLLGILRRLASAIFVSIRAEGLWATTVALVTEAFGGLAAVLAVIFSPGVLIGAAIAGTALFVKHLLDQQKAASEAAIATYELGINTNDAAKAIGVANDSLSKARDSLDSYNKSVDKTTSAGSKLAKLFTKKLDTGNTNKFIKEGNKLILDRRDALKSLIRAEKKRDDQRKTLGLDINEARSKASLIGAGIARDKSDLQHVKNLISAKQKALKLDDSSRRTKILEGITAEELKVGINDGLSAQRKVLELEYNIAKAKGDQYATQKALNLLEAQRAKTRVPSFSQALASVRRRRATAAEHAGTRGGGNAGEAATATALALRHPGLGVRAALLQEVLHTRAGIISLAGAADTFRKSIHGAISNKKEVASFATALESVGKTDVGHNLLLSLSPNIDKMIAKAKEGKDKSNNLLALIGSSNTGVNIAHYLGINLKTAEALQVASVRRMSRKSIESAADTVRSSLSSVFGPLSKGKKKGVKSPLAIALTAGTAGDVFSTISLIATQASAKASVRAAGVSKTFTDGLRSHLRTQIPAVTSSAAALAKTGGVNIAASLVSGLSTGIKDQLNPKSALYKLLHVDIVDFIKKNKGPIEYDRTILIPAGHSIMDGLKTGLEQGFTPVKSFLRRVGPSMSEFVPDKLFGDRVAEFLVQGVSSGGKYPDPSTFFADLAQGIGGGGIGAATGIIDPALSFLHRTMSLADTTQMANSLAKTFGGGVSSIFRSYDTVAGPNVSDHTRGTAADFTGSVGTLDAMAARIKPLFGNIFKQIIWRNHDLNNGAFIPHHGPGDNQHLHAAWLMANGFSLNSSKFGKSEGGLAAGSGPSTPFNKFFAQASAMFHVPASLLKAVTKAESGFNPNAGSSAGARGLMQLLPGTFASQHVGGNILDPRQNIFAGAKYLASQLNRFHNTSLAVAAYNAGPGAVQSAHGIPGFAETIAYVKRVLGFLSDFGGFRAMGGGVSGNKGYVVGERGPEYVVPRRSGFVLSNDRIDRMLRVLERQASGGGGGEWNMHVHSNSVDPHVVASIAKTHWNAQLVGVRL